MSDAAARGRPGRLPFRGTSTKQDTVNQAVAAVAALSARRRDLEQLAADLHADLRDADIMSNAWQR